LTNVTAGLAGLQSYKATFTMTFEGTDSSGNPQSGSFSSVEEFSANPPAKRTSFTGTGTADMGAGGAFELIEVDGQSYSIFGDTCFSSEATDAPTASAMFDPSTVIGGVQASQLIGVENVGGVSTRHYLVDLSSLQALSSYTDGKADVWVADPGNYVVKYTFEATGADQFFGFTGSGEGTVRWDYEVNNINQPVNITAPENCGGAPEDIPLMPDAAGVSSFGDLTTYTSATPLADVVAFYQAQMPANGWTESPGGLAQEGFAQLTFTKDGRTASITITSDPSSGTSVLISLSGE
jgi:hypothetical protein